ncbi:MAG: AtpZ/AtpI family protein [Chloroflexi bacterium]|nr:AtpZ/AtpI family protein [Chloroflexota bacterium]
MIQRHPLLFRFLYLTVVVLVFTAVPLAVGVWADRRLETEPWLTLAGVLVGVTIATVGIWRIIRRTYIRLAQPSARKGKQ